jgi:predicted RNA-binding protein with PUA-like domain
MNNITKEEAIQILFLLQALMRHFTFDDLSKSRVTNKLIKQLARWMTKLRKSNPGYYVELQKKTNEIWNEVRNEINDKDFLMSMTVGMRSLMYMLDGSKYQEMAFRMSTFEKSCQSIDGNYYATRNKEDLHVEQQANKLVDLFASKIGIKKENKLSILKQNVKTNLILEGKIS